MTYQNKRNVNNTFFLQVKIFNYMDADFNASYGGVKTPEG